MNGKFDDIETTRRKSAQIQERMGLISNYMYKQFVEYQQSNANAIIMLDKLAENMALAVEYLRQSFNMRGIPAQNIYFEYDKQHNISVINILWHTITFVANMKGTPLALERSMKEMPSLITSRIFALKGIQPDLSHGFNNEIEQKLLEMEVASLFVPPDKSMKAIIKIKNLGNQEFFINQQDAPREFLLKVIEMVCRDGNFHKESLRVSLTI